MARPTLVDYYEQKYAHEKESQTIEVMKQARIPRGAYETYLKQFTAYFKGGDILELGSGSGIVAKSLLQSNLNIRSYTASDISSPRLMNLRNNLRDNRLRILELDAEHISEGQCATYDAIIMLAVIEHLVDPLGAMGRIRSALKPGGFAYISTPNIAKYTRRVKLLLGRFPATSSKDEGLVTYSGRPAQLHEEGHLHYFTYRSLSLMLTNRCGFSRIEKLGYSEGYAVFGKAIHYCLARAWPELFSDITVVAWA